MPRGFRRFAMPAVVIAALAAVPAVIQAAGPAGDAAAGKLVFAKCAICHSMAPGDNRLGPTLAGVVGRKAGTVPGYNYSPAMKNAGLIWTPANLDAYLANPRGKLPGVKMIFVGLPKPEDRANVIAYLTNPK